MTQAERDRLVALKKAKKKLITQKQAAEEIGVAERQVRRLLLYRGFGPTLAAEYLLTIRWDGKFYQIDRRDIRTGMRKAMVRVEQRLDAHSVRALRSQGFPPVGRLLLFLPALRLFPGQTPAQLLRFRCEGNCVMSPPVSARILAALRSCTPGTVCRSCHCRSRPAA